MTSPNSSHEEQLRQRYLPLAHCIRVLTIDAVEQARSGHPGMPLGMADIATMLFSQFLNFAPQDPNWLNRDRFILSAGHGSMLLYSLLYLTGYPDISLDDLKSFRQFKSKTAGHPEHHLLAGVETTTGPLAQGLGNAIGMALARTIQASKLNNPDLLDHKIYTIVGDGCLMEGLSHEVCSFAGHLRLTNLIVLYDSNEITIDGKAGLSASDDTAKRFQAYGWHTQTIDGHNFAKIEAALEVANQQSAERPCIIICNTCIAYGCPTKSGCCSSHGAPLGADEAKAAKKSYGWSDDEAFAVSDELLAVWRNEISQRSAKKYAEWQQRVAELPADQKAVLENLRKLKLDEKLLEETVRKFKESYLLVAPHPSPAHPNPSDLCEDAAGEGCGATPHQLAANTKPPLEATRESSGKILAKLAKFVPFIGGSADLTESNFTKAPGMLEAGLNKPGPWNYIHYGVREHGMASIMNGLALYGGCVPYGGSFLVFVDYARPAIRMSALMGLHVIYVMTHDSIGVGEDGPTHQPIEQLASLRSIPNLQVFRPADAVETAECWELALKHRTGPSVLSLTRQKVPQIRQRLDSRLSPKQKLDGHAARHCEERSDVAIAMTDCAEPKLATGKTFSACDTIAPNTVMASAAWPSSLNLSARGAYIISETLGHLDAIILATGSEVSVALSAQAQLLEQGIGTRVVSIPCFELFDQQDQAYKDSLLNGADIKLALEAAAEFGWGKYLGTDGIFIGLNRFGMSAPAKNLFDFFGITPENVVHSIMEAKNKIQ